MIARDRIVDGFSRLALPLAVLVVLAGIAGHPAPAHATNWFVDGVNGRSNASGTAAAPFRNFYQSQQVVQPGDTIYVLPTTLYPQISITVSGTAGHPITVAGAGAAPRRTRVSGGVPNPGIYINANYITLTNFDVTTNGQQSAITVDTNHHHVTISNNVAHDAGGNGILEFGDDYITISHNIVYGNSWDTAAASGSGISLLGSLDIDSSTGVKIIVDSNTVYGNTNTPFCSTQQCYATASDSDGSGIIDDNSRRTRFDQVAYHGRTLISNNVVFGNGGRGVHVYLSDHVTIADNTMYSNNQDPYEGSYHPGEAMANTSGDVQFYNNVLYSDGLNAPGSGSTPNTHVGLSAENCTLNTGPIIGRYNLIFNPQNVQTSEYYNDPANTVSVDFSQNTWIDPKLEHLSLVAAVADFRPKPLSPALHHADSGTSVAYDFLGVARVIPPTIGAYENPGP